MYWDIKNADTYTLYSPLKLEEIDFISALNSIDLSTNNIILDRKILSDLAISDAPTFEKIAKTALK